MGRGVQSLTRNGRNGLSQETNAKSSNQRDTPRQCEELPNEHRFLPNAHILLPDKLRNAVEVVVQ